MSNLLHSTGGKVPILAVPRFAWRSLIVALLFGITFACDARAEHSYYLSDAVADLTMHHQQQWGEFGRDTAAAAPGRPGSPMRIGEKVYDKGLGHHANGEIVVELGGQYSQLHTWIGVQWQGGGKGSVIFQVQVDGKTVFESQPLSDSEPAQEVSVPLDGAQQLRLVATDAGDGIGCDMANWADARLVRCKGLPLFGSVFMTLSGQTAPPASSSFCGFSVIAAPSGPQVAVMAPAAAFSVAVCQGESARLEIPFQDTQSPIQVTANVCVSHGSGADVELAIGDQRVRRFLAAGESAQLSITGTDLDGAASIVASTYGANSPACVKWTRIRYQLEDQSSDIPLRFPEAPEDLPPPELPELRGGLQQELIEWDWRMQDGIGTVREPRNWAEAVARLFTRGDRLLSDLQRASVPLDDLTQQWEQLKIDWKSLSESSVEREDDWENFGDACTSCAGVWYWPTRWPIPGRWCLPSECLPVSVTS